MPLKGQTRLPFKKKSALSSLIPYPTNLEDAPIDNKDPSNSTPIASELNTPF